MHHSVVEGILNKSHPLCNAMQRFEKPTIPSEVFELVTTFSRTISACNPEGSVPNLFHPAAGRHNCIELYCIVVTRTTYLASTTLN